MFQSLPIITDGDFKKKKRSVWVITDKCMDVTEWEGGRGQG
jgi:hypothetical protein